MFSAGKGPEEGSAAPFCGVVHKNEGCYKVTPLQLGLKHFAKASKQASRSLGVSQMPCIERPKGHHMIPCHPTSTAFFFVWIHNISLDPSPPALLVPIHLPGTRLLNPFLSVTQWIWGATLVAGALLSMLGQKWHIPGPKKSQPPVICFPTSMPGPVGSGWLGPQEVSRMETKGENLVSGTPVHMCGERRRNEVQRH